MQPNSLGTDLDRSLAALASVQHAVVKHQWEHIQIHLQAYDKAIAHLKACVPIPTIHQNKFKYLAYRHRCVMRLIAQAQATTQESIQASEQGIHKLKQASAFAKSVYQ